MPHEDKVDIWQSLMTKMNKVSTDICSTVSGLAMLARCVCVCV